MSRSAQQFISTLTIAKGRVTSKLEARNCGWWKNCVRGSVERGKLEIWIRLPVVSIVVVLCETGFTRLLTAAFP